eukprot:scaffold38597_cov59-Attheya_sp.AAC.1
MVTTLGPPVALLHSHIWSWALKTARCWPDVQEAKPVVIVSTVPPATGVVTPGLVTTVVSPRYSEPLSGRLQCSQAPLRILHLCYTNVNANVVCFFCESPNGTITLVVVDYETPVARQLVCNTSSRGHPFRVTFYNCTASAASSTTTKFETYNDSVHGLTFPSSFRPIGSARSKRCPIRSSPDFAVDGSIGCWQRSQTNMFIAFTPVHDFTSLSSFGSVGALAAQTILPKGTVRTLAEKTEKNFNNNIGDWDVSSDTDFSFMFEGADEFTQDIGGWDVSSGTYFDIGGWDASSGTDFVSTEDSFGFQFKTIQYASDLIGSSNE